MTHLGAWRAQLVAVGLLLGFPLALGAQDRQISGRVTRAPEGGAIAGATVTVIGAPAIEPVRADERGRFTIRAPAGEVRLAFRAIGFTPVEATVPAGQNSVDVEMAADVFRLGEVVVTGQATTAERRDATTSIGYVAGEDLSRVAAPTIESALAPRVAGVNVQSNSGAPGGGMQLKIRGSTTILGAADPLVVVDGVIYSNASIPSLRYNATAGVSKEEDDAVNRLADLNPAEIQSIEILKGAAASSIYGSKASNGVVVVRTIRGQEGRPRINLAQRAGTFDLLRKYDARCYSLAEAVARFGETANDFAEGGTLPCFNHYDQVFGENEVSYETVADVSGGSETTKYFVSGTWKRDEGIAENTGFGRQALRLNLDQWLSDRWDVRVSTSFNHSSTQRGFTNNGNNFGPLGYALAYIPSYIDLRRQGDGSFPLPVGSGVPSSNPVQTQALGLNDEDVYRFTGGATLTWRVLETDRNLLSVVGQGGADIFNQKNRVNSPPELYFEQPQNQPGTAIDVNGISRLLNWNLNGLWTFTPDGSGWSSLFSAGAQYEDQRLRVSSITTTNLVPGQSNLTQGTTFIPTDSLAEERTFALYANEELRLLQNRLLLSAGLRAERSSANGNIDKFYVFPRASAAYFLPIFQDDAEIKVRAGYGETGNQPRFGQKFTLLNTPQLGGRSGFTIDSAAGFGAIEPERLREWELGIDASSANGRLVLEATYYNRTTSNLFLNRVPAPSSGFSNQLFNGGKIRNQGLELGLGVTTIQTRNVQWVARGNFTVNRSKVLELPVPPFRPPQSGFGGLGVTFIEEGQPLTQIIGFAFDENGERTETQVKLGDSSPDFRVGFNTDFAYRAVNVNLTLDWQQGGSVINLTQFLYDDAGTTPDFGSAEHARRLEAQAAGVMTPYIEDASFLKLREVSIGYTVPQGLVDALGIGATDARISLTGRNLLMWTEYSGLDPEVANFGSAAIRNNLDITPFPPSRSVFLNLALGF